MKETKSIPDLIALQNIQTHTHTNPQKTKSRKSTPKKFNIKNNKLYLNIHTQNISGVNISFYFKIKWGTFRKYFGYITIFNLQEN